MRGLARKSTRSKRNSAQMENAAKLKFYHPHSLWKDELETLKHGKFEI
jgi:hypothetical protein